MFLALQNQEIDFAVLPATMMIDTVKAIISKHYSVLDAYSGADFEWKSSLELFLPLPSFREVATIPRQTSFTKRLVQIKGSPFVYGQVGQPRV